MASTPPQRDTLRLQLNLCDHCRNIQDIFHRVYPTLNFGFPALLNLRKNLNSFFTKETFFHFKLPWIVNLDYPWIIKQLIGRL